MPIFLVSLLLTMPQDPSLQPKVALDPEVPGASRITIQGKGLRLSSVLRELQEQSGNRISDLREAYGEDPGDPVLDLDIGDKPFLEALDVVARKAGLVPNFFTGDGSIGLMPRLPGVAEANREGRWLAHDGPFRAVLKRISATRELASGRGQASVEVEVAWEPRLRPWLLTVKSADLAIVDDRGQAVPPDVPDASVSLPLRPENPVVAVKLAMKAPDRAARMLRTLRARFQVTAPAGLHLFRFPNLGARNVAIEHEGTRVTLVSTTVDQDLWSIRLDLEMPGQGVSLESFQQGLFQNRIWLERADGSRIEHEDGQSSDQVGPGRFQFEYFFSDLPGRPSDYRLVHEAPSRVVTIPLELNFEDVPLP